jgi:hypothetical protein
MAVIIKTQMPTKKRLSLPKPIWVTLAILVIAALVVTGLELTNTTHLFHTAPPIDTGPTNSAANSETKGEPANPSPSPADDQSPPGDDKSSSNPNAALLTPSGNFVSNHRPNLSGSPAPNSMESTCTTTPGATCQILFTRNGVTKSLDAQTTDRNGSAFWSWKLQDIGLTEGSWQIQAKATLNNQTKTANDSLNLEVGP